MKVQEEQIKRLQAIKERRDKPAVKQCLANLKIAAQGSENIMPAILNAVKAYTTLGEICGILREVFGEFQEAVTL